MKFLEPGRAIWFLLIPLIISFWLVQSVLKQKFRQDAGLGQAVRALSNLSPLRSDIVTLIFALITITALVMAIMRPQIRFESLLPEYEHQDLVLLLDRSVSMYARDILPSRFDRAIDEIKVFLAEKPEQIDRVALIGFAGAPMTLSYLTRDLDTLFFFLEWIRDDPQIYYGTNITDALIAAREMVRNDSEPTRKIFLLLSDGDDQSTELGGLLNELRQENIHVHSIGIGSDDAVPIPLSRQREDTLFLENEDGTRLNTLFDESTLRRVASATAGSFSRSSTGRELADTMEQLVSRDRQQIGWQHLHDYRDIYLPLLILSCITTFFLILRR